MLRTIFPWRCNDDWTGHPPFALTRYLSRTDLRAELWVRTAGPRARAAFVRAAMRDRTEHVVAIANRINRRVRPARDWVGRLFDMHYVRGLRQGDVAHVYRNCSLRMFDALKASGVVVALELSNTMPHTAYAIFEDAYRRAGWPVKHDLEPPALQHELDVTLRKARTADVIFCPSPAVAESVRAVGIPESRILATSYGWEPARFSEACGESAPALPPIDGTTVLFVGTVCERKGAHLLLDAWSRARIAGRLVLLGGVGQYLASQCSDLLNRPDVSIFPFTPDPAPFFRSADMLVLPTLEEGSPLVTYEAMGIGLPVLTSPMGAGTVIRHDRDGLVVDPHDREALIAALRRLAGDVELRRTLAGNGRARAREYTWDRVAARRYELIQRALRQTVSGPPDPPVHV